MRVAGFLVAFGVTLAVVGLGRQMHADPIASLGVGIVAGFILGVTIGSRGKS